MRYISQNRLISELGWSMTLVRKYLSTPHSLCLNPLHGNYPLMKLYNTDIVNSISLQENFIADFRKAKERSRKIQETKKLKRNS